MATMPELYLICANISKKGNLGTIVRSACAFGCREILVVGLPHWNCFGAFGSDRHMTFRKFENYRALREWCSENSVLICGVEIMPEATSITAKPSPFTGTTAIMLGNEGSGMTDNQKRICDFFVYIPQYGSGTASLNVTVAGSIVLHHFSVWANFEERERQDGLEKFAVKVAPPSGTISGEERGLLQLERRQRAEALERDEEEASLGGSLFGEEEEAE